MANIYKLKAKIVENNTTQEAISGIMGINRTTFCRKMKNNGEHFTVEDVQKLIKILSLSNKDVMTIFFNS
ncbi:MAG: XRE family transcriptional regulator [Eubacterium sp.]|jgi:hypothetical protein|nr:XRE family transcriptional regulator [Eubacterium sp.]